MKNFTGYNEAEKFRSRYLLRFLLLSFITVLTAWNFCVGFIVLMLRQAGYGWFNFMLAAVAGIPLGFLIALLMLRKVKITSTDALAVVDSYNHAGGLLLAISETRDPKWAEKLPGSYQLPEMKVNFNRRLPALIISAVFLFAGIKVPLIHFASARTQTMDLGETGQNVQLQIETLEDSEVIDGEEAEDLKETMNQIMEKADRNAPGKTFEAIDQMREKLKNSAQKAMQTARDEQGELNRIDKLNRELESALNSNNSGAAKSISEEIKNELDKSAAAKKMGSGLNEGFSKAADSFASGAQNSKEELTKAVQELKDYIRQRTEELKQMSDKLQKARLVDRKTFEELKKQQQSGGKNGGKGASDKDSELIMAPSDSDRNGMSSDGSANGGEGPSDKNGMAGVSTDGGHPPLKYNRKTSEHNAGYKDEKLPDPGIGSIEDSVAIGAGVAAPLTEEGPLTSGQGSVSDFQAFDKSSGQNKMLLPRHRNPVKRYFSND